MAALKNDFELFNDLEVSAFALERKLKDIKSKLTDMGFEKVVMTGSGSSFICMGNIKPFKLKSVKFYQVFSVQRSLSDWFNI